MRTDFKVQGIESYRAGFFGDCFGVVLLQRSQTDRAVMFQIVSEDDGNWFKEDDGSGSAYWIPDLLEQLTRAKDWSDANTNQVFMVYEFKER